MSPKAPGDLLPDNHLAYAFYGEGIAFEPMWRKPTSACPGRYLDDPTLAALVGDSGRASAGSDVPVTLAPSSGLPQKAKPQAKPQTKEPPHAKPQTKAPSDAGALAAVVQPPGGGGGGESPVEAAAGQDAAANLGSCRWLLTDKPPAEPPVRTSIPALNVEPSNVRAHSKARPAVPPVPADRPDTGAERLDILPAAVHDALEAEDYQLALALSLSAIDPTPQESAAVRQQGRSMSRSGSRSIRWAGAGDVGVPDAVPYERVITDADYGDIYAPSPPPLPDGGVVASPAAQPDNQPGAPAGVHPPSGSQPPGPLRAEMERYLQVVWQGNVPAATAPGASAGGTHPQAARWAMHRPGEAAQFVDASSPNVADPYRWRRLLADTDVVVEQAAGAPTNAPTQTVRRAPPIFLPKEANASHGVPGGAASRLGSASGTYVAPPPPPPPLPAVEVEVESGAASLPAVAVAEIAGATAEPDAEPIPVETDPPGRWRDPSPSPATLQPAMPTSQSPSPASAVDTTPCAFTDVRQQPAFKSLAGGSAVQQQEDILSQIQASLSDPTVQQMHRATPPFFPHLWLSLQPPSVHPLHSDDACRVMTVCSYVSSNCFQSWVKYCHE